MTQELYGLLSASAGYVVVAGFLALVALLIIQRRRLHVWKRAHRLISADHRALLAKYHELRGLSMTADDRELLTSLAEELQSCVVTANGDVLLDDAEGFNIATYGVPAPVIEIEYADRLVTLTLAVEHYTEEEIAEWLAESADAEADAVEVLG